MDSRFLTGFSLFFLILLLNFPQNGISQLKLEWQNQYKLDLHPSSLIYRISDKQNIFIAGHDIHENADVHVFKFNSAGDQEWHYTYDGDSMLFENINDLLITSQEKVVLCGETFRRFDLEIDVVLDASSSAFIIQLNEHGEEEWVGNFNTRDTSFAAGKHISQIDDSLLVLLVKEDFVQGSQLLFNTYHQPDGKLESTKVLHSYSEINEVQIGIYENSGILYFPVLVIEDYWEYAVIRNYDLRGIILDTFIINPPHYFAFYSNMGEEQFFGALTVGLYGLSKLNRMGMHVWDYSIPKNLPENSFADRINRIISNARGIFTTGMHYGTSTKGDVLTKRFDANGSVLWSHRYQNENLATYESGNDMVQINNQVVIGGQQQADSAGFSDFLLMILDAEKGSLIEKKVTDFGGDDRITRIFPLNDHDFYVFGISNQSTETLVIQRYGLPTSIEESTPVSDLIVYPVPSNRSLYIYSTHPIGRVEIFDLNGNLVTQSSNFSELNLKIELDYLIPGSYYCKVYHPKGQEVRKFIVAR